MGVSHIIAMRSVDPRYKVGAVIVNQDGTQVLSVGYNGDYRGGPNVVESEEPGESGMIHAEINALIKLDYNYPQRKVMYLTMSPCKMCAKSIVNAGIAEVVYGDEYRDPSGLEILRTAGVKARKFPLDDNI
jgi:dCMP deaminase